MVHVLQPPFRSLSTLSLVALGALMAGAVACSDDDTVDLGEPAPGPDLGVADTGMKDTGAEDTGATTDTGTPDTGSEMDMGEDPMLFVTLDPPSFNFPGPSEDRVDLVFIGDGYADGELASAYQQHVEHLANRMFTRRSRGATEPFRQFRDMFNVHRVDLASNESGIGDQAKDTLLGGSTGCAGGAFACEPTVDTALTKAAVERALMDADPPIQADIIIVTLNTPEPVENAIVDENGKFAIYGGGPTDDEDVDTSERGLRQLARAMAGLAVHVGGSGTYAGDEPAAANLTTSSTGAKWAAWVGFNAANDDQGAVSAIQGGGAYDNGLFRPVSESKLTGDYPGPFDPVAREAIIVSIFDVVPPIIERLSTPTNSTLENPDFIDATPAANLVDVQWFVTNLAGGEPIDTGVSGGRIGFVQWAGFEGIPFGSYEVEARISIRSRFPFPEGRGGSGTQTDFIRQPSSTMTDSVKWRVIYRRQ